MPTGDQQEMENLVAGLSTKSDKIRKLVRAGYRQVDVARFLNISSQFVSNVMRHGKIGKIEGFSDSGSSEYINADSNPKRMRLRADSAGRVLLPAHIRQLMGLGADDGELIADLTNGVLQLMTPAMAVKRAQKLVRELIPGNDSLADELIEDRRKEAARESNSG